MQITNSHHVQRELGYLISPLPQIISFLKYFPKFVPRVNKGEKYFWFFPRSFFK